MAGNAVSDCRLTDLVIVDLFVPEHGGLETIRRILSKDPAARMMAISGIGLNERGELLSMARTAGAQHVMTKPVEPAAFHAAIDRLLTL